MPFQEKTVMSQKKEFVRLATADGANISELCQRYNISRDTGYRWLTRYRREGVEGLKERSRMPHTSPKRSSEALEAAVLETRREHPSWGGRKIRTYLLENGVEEVPSASTVHAILRRHGALREDRREHRDFIRFEHEAPNQLWQMDFKGHFATGTVRCHPLTLLDDHSRFSLCIKACADEQHQTVQSALVEVFRRYGLPERMTMDNGNPWGCDSPPYYTALTVWLVRLGIRVGHSRPYHPQTQGKLERFHRTLKGEVLNFHTFRDLDHCQDHFDRWRDVYNLERPHEALGMAVPADRYQPSSRPYPEHLPPLEYAPGDIVRKVQDKGEITVKGRYIVVGKAFKGLHVALRPCQHGEKWEVYFCHQRVAEVDLRELSG